MRMNALKTLALILSLSRDEATFPAFQLNALLNGYGDFLRGERRIIGDVISVADG